MKRLFQFTLQQEITKTIEEKSTDKEGNEVTVTKDVKEFVDKVITLKKPNRIMFDDAELYYGVELSKGIKAGLLTRALLSKRFSNDGGVMSEPDKEEYADLYLELFNNQTEIERMSATAAKSRSEHENKKFTEAVKESGALKRRIQDFELAQASLFEQTAENRARNKTILWWVLRMAHMSMEGEEGYDLIFKGNQHEERLSSYDEMEESEDPFHEELLKKLIYYVSYWYVGNAQTEEEFKKLLGELEASGVEGVAMEALDEAAVEKENPTKKTDESKKKATKKKKTKKEAPAEETPAEETPAKETPAEGQEEGSNSNA
jgi:hypothetical protein